MGIDITEIGQKVLDVTSNAANIFRKMYDLHFNPNPLDVPFEYIDENGNKVTTTIKNVAGFRKKVWDDVGGALGQFSRTFYVDAVNGDDNNTGASDSPFKTLSKALNSIPYGGKGVVVLLTDLELANEPAPIQIGGKVIYIKLNGHTLSKTNTYNVLYASDFFTYLKIANGNASDEANVIIRNDDTVASTRKGLLSVVDGSATVVIGDWDSNLNVDMDDGLIYSFRGYTEGGFIKTAFKSTNGIPVVWSDNSNVVFKQNACNFTNTKLTNAYFRPENETPLPSDVAIYIDAENGNDNNTGFSIDSPVKTLKQAIKISIPGTRNTFYLLSDVYHNEYCYVSNRQIKVSQYDNRQVTLTLDVTTTGLPSIVLIGSANFIINCDLNVKNNLLDVSRYAIDVPATGAIHISYAKNEDGTARQAKVNIGDYAKIARINGQFTNWQADFNYETDNSSLFSILRYAHFGTTASTTVAGEAITADNARITGIVKDSNGVPRNITTNLIL